MLERTQSRALPVLNKAVDLTPAAQACCGVCRTCVQTNVFTLAAAVLVGAGAYASRFARRLWGS